MTAAEQKQSRVSADDTCQDMECCLQNKIRRIRRGTKIRLIVWSVVLVSLIWGLVSFVCWADGFLQYPSWLGQWTEETAYRELPYWADSIETIALNNSQKTTGKMAKESLRAISRARRNSARDGRKWIAALAKKTDENISLLVEEIIEKHGITLKKQLIAPGDESIKTAFVQQIDEETKQFIESVIREEPRWRSIDLLVAVSNKMKELEENKNPSIEEELESRLVALIATLLWKSGD